MIGSRALPRKRGAGTVFPIVRGEIMLRINGSGALKHSRPCRWLPCLLGGLALGGAALAGQDGVEGAAVKGSAAHTTYRITQLGSGMTVALKINAGGQVAFSRAADAFSDIDAWFYDGKQVRRIVPPAGGAYVTVTGLNDAGQVTGDLTIASGDRRGFVWRNGDGMRDLGTLPGATYTLQPVINHRGEVAGTSGSDALPAPRAFRWTPAGGIRSLGALTSGAAADSYARAINDDGMIAGDSLASVGGGNDSHAIVWTPASGMVDIDTLGNHYSSAVAIGARGQVAGNYLNPPDNINQGFIWTRGQGMRGLGSAGGIGADVVGMSPGGRVVGAIDYPGTRQHAMTWTRNAGMLDLGTLGGATSIALAANDKGQVVGRADLPGESATHAFVWTAREGMVDLNARLRHAPPGLVVYQAEGINDNGAIVAEANTGPVLLTPDDGPCHGHVSGPIASPDVVQAGTAFVASLGFVAEDAAASHRVSWSWGDGSQGQTVRASGRRGDGIAAASHAYQAPGVYTVTASIAGQGGEPTAVSRKVVVLDPAGGFAAGTGTYMAASGGAGKVGPGAGKATFSFIAPLTVRTESVKAQAGLSFDTAGLSFRSTDIRLVDKEGTRARFAGSGTVDGKGGYRFSMTTTAGAAAGSGEPGRFGLKIWHADPVTKAEVVDYDDRGRADDAVGHALVEGKIAGP
jgi:probable HAF family extracellular repeat protein